MPSIALRPRLAPLAGRLLLALALPGAVLLGIVIAARPSLAIGAMALALVAALALLAPVAHLTLLLIVTAIVPYDLQNAYGFGAGAGLIFSDVLLLTGLLRATLAIFRVALPRRHVLAGAVLGVLLVIAAVQTVRGHQAGAPLSLAGFEFRSLLGWSTLFIAVPILAEPRGRRRLLAGLIVTGLLLGLWGLVQYFVNIPIIGGGSSGVRQNINFTEGGRSIQGGLFGFPIAFLLGLAALTAGERLPPVTRTALFGVVGMNGAALLLTYQRTFWLGAIVGFLFLIARAGGAQRLKSVGAGIAAATVLLPAMAVASPGALTAVQQRFLSIGQYSTDNSVRARITENRAVVRQIREAPLRGSGLGDEVSFGYPWLQVPPTPTPYTHNGYLWLTWKLGLPAALLLIALIGWSVVAKAPRLIPLHRRVRHGAQAGLLLTLTVSLTFPAFRALAITTTLGILVALSLMGDDAAADEELPASAAV